MVVRTSTIAKNRHLNIVLRAELHLRTGTYDRPNLAIDASLAIDAYLRMASYQFGIYRSSCPRGKGFLTHFR